MLRIRKGKKIIADGYKSAYNIADDIKSDKLQLKGIASNATDVLERDAFYLAIKGAKLRLGNGYIVEAEG